MNSPSFDGLVKEIEKSLDQIADAVLERGYDHIPEEFDDYSLMMGEFEYQKVITFQLYENYFLPKRHEFELELISKIVAGIGKSQTAVFLSSAILAGIVGNASYALVRKLLSHIISKFKKDPKLSVSFKEMNKNIEKVYNYFGNHDEVNLKQIASELHIDAVKIEPLLKLLGFKCKRRGKQQVWIKPKY